MSSSQNADPERDLLEGTSKQHGEMNEQTKRYTFMSTDNQLHTGHAGTTNISSCQNSGVYTDTLTYKKSVSNVIEVRVLWLVEMEVGKKVVNKTFTMSRVKLG